MSVRTNLGRGVILIVNFISLIYLQYILGANYDYKLFLFRVGPFIYWIAYYALGVYLSSQSRQYSIKYPILIMLLGFLGQLAETNFYLTEIGFPVSILFYSCGCILLLFSKRVQTIVEKYNGHLYWLVSIGRYSFIIYLIHYYIITKCHFLLTLDNWFINWMIISILTCIIVRILDYVTPKNMKFLLGFK